MKSPDFPTDKSSRWEHNIRHMFAGIADSYDLLNRLMTFGQDRVWRQCAVKAARVSKGGRLLDTGTGTGSIALESLQGDATLSVVGSDFTPEMMMIGRQRRNGDKIFWVAADGQALSFPDACFDAATSGYLIRNVFDRRRAFEEQLRVVKPGGRIVCLDTSPPTNGPFLTAILFFLNRVIPLLGKIFADNPEAYTYLQQSTQNFLTPAEVAAIMRSAGLQNVRYQRFMFGTIAVHIGIRPK